MTHGAQGSFAEVTARLEATIAARRGGDPSHSYTARLLADPKLAAKKLGEEAVETVIAALSEDKDALTREAADLIYHLIALLAGREVSLGDVAQVLAAREGVSGLQEKAARPREP